MARASYLTRRDGRYVFQIRFATGKHPGDPKKVLRFALRTGSYPVAVRRMVQVMSLITEFRFCPDLTTRVDFARGQLFKALHLRGPLDEEAIVQWTALEAIVGRTIADCRAANHPFVLQAPDLPRLWGDFLTRLATAESRRRLPTEPAPDCMASFSSENERAVRVWRQPLTQHATDGVVGFRSDWERGRSRLLYDDDDLAEELTPSVAETISAAPPLTVCEPTAAIPAAAAPSKSAAPLRLSQSVANYLDARAIEFGDRRSDESDGRILQFAITFLGDPLVGDITREHLRDLEAVLPKIPARIGVPRKYDRSLFTRYSYAIKQKRDFTPISGTTLRNTYHGGLNRFLVWMTSKGEPLPTFKFNLVPRAMPAPLERDAFERDELVQLFSLPLFTGCRSREHIWKPGNYFHQNELYWGFVLLYFTGMRHSEIAKLRTEDVIGRDGFWFFDLSNQPGDKAASKRTLKSKAAFRLVPIPDVIIKLGLLDRAAFMKKHGQTRLFPEWHVYMHKRSGRPNWGHHLSKSWQYIKGLFKRKGLTSYAGRHTRASIYDALGIPQRTRDLLLGHAPPSVSGHYGSIAISTEEVRLLFSKSHPHDEAVSAILLNALDRVERGELIKLHPAAVGKTGGGERIRPARAMLQIQEPGSAPER